MTLELPIRKGRSQSENWVLRNSGLSTLRAVSMFATDSTVSMAEPAPAIIANPKSELLAEARQRLVELLNDAPELWSPVQRGLQAMTYLMFDGAPRPQIDRAASGGLETEWLVGGRSVILLNGLRGDDALWSLGLDRLIEFRGRFNVHAMAGDPIVQRALAALRDQAADLESATLAR